MSQLATTNQNSEDHVAFAQLAAGGDIARKALGALYDRYARKFLGYLSRRGFTAEEAEDIVQDAFIKIARIGAKAADVQQPRAYLWRTLSNCSADLLRARQRSPQTVAPRRGLDDEDGADMDQFAHPDYVDGDDQDFLLCFQRTLTQFGQLNPEGANAIEMAVIEGFSGTELATALERTYGATREFLSQCRKKFGQMLAELCYDYMPASMKADT